MTDGARAALERGAWQDALDALENEPAVPEVLEMRAHALYALGQLEASIASWEEAYAHHVAADEREPAARAAAMIAMYLMMDTGLMAPVRGWLRRADGWLDGGPETGVHALIAMVRTYERFMCGDMDGARVQSARAIDLGERYDVDPAVVIGRVAAARVRIFDGEVAEGLDLLDEVGALLMSGGADPLTTGMMYCELICAAQGLALHDRAAEWTEVMERWRHGAAVGGINGRCRVHRAEMLRVSGPCDLAEAEAIAACAELRPWMRREYGWPLVELGTIRLRRGDLAGAEAAFIEAHENAWSPQPGLALLRLEQGEVAAATALITDAIEHPVDIPWKERPPFGDLRLAPLLEARVEIAVAAADVEVAREAADRLESIAASYPSRSLAAGAALARARAALVGHDHDTACEAAAVAAGTWADLGAPFESARARIVLGEAMRAAGKSEGARMEWHAAEVALGAFGAELWAERAAELVATCDGRVGPGSAEAEAEAGPDGAAVTATFRSDGDTRTVRFAGRTVHLRDLKGFRYLERLVADPGREHHVLDLVALDRGALTETASGAGAADDADIGSTFGAGLPVLDDQARAAYRRRLAEIDDDIDEATRMNDTARVELATADREYLIHELKRAVGLGGRERVTGGAAERARTSVTRSIRYALARLAEHHAEVATHLDQHVQTGAYCRYAADPFAPVDWEV